MNRFDREIKFENRFAPSNICTVAAVAIAAAVVGAAATSYSANKAAGAQEDAANQSNDTQTRMYNQTRADQEPYRKAGYGALSQLEGLVGTGGEFNRDFAMSDFQTDPGYQFRQSEGMKGLERSASARGGLLSGATLKGIDRYNQDFASNEYNNAYNRFNTNRTNRFNRLSAMAGIGQTANAQVQAAGTNAANNISQGQQAVGNARASGYVAQGNAINQGLSGAANAYSGGAYMSMLNQAKSQNYGGYGNGPY